KDGTYPLTRTIKLIVPQSQLQNVPIQSLLWLIFSDENFTLLENQSFVGISFGDLPNIRSNLQTSFDAAVAAAETANVLTAPVTGDTSATEEAGSTAEPVATDEPAATDEAASPTDEVVVTEEATVTEEVVVTEEATATEETAATDEPAATDEAAPTATPAA
ncbi:MAG TPA: hypothetical protein VHL11_07160, partial [Phototrophicaceae bacterium]|nr:hypothetical protein [Phototrophicaceae bacterium]